MSTAQSRPSHRRVSWPEQHIKIFIFILSFHRTQLCRPFLWLCRPFQSRVISGSEPRDPALAARRTSNIATIATSALVTNCHYEPFSGLNMHIDH